MRERHTTISMSQCFELAIGSCFSFCCFTLHRKVLFLIQKVVKPTNNKVLLFFFCGLISRKYKLIALTVYWTLKLFCRSLKGVLTDYIHGEYMKPFVNPSILILSILAFAGLCLLNINDVGFSRALRKIYTDL